MLRSEKSKGAKYGFSIFWETIFMAAWQSTGAVSSRAIIDYDRRLDLKPLPGEKTERGSR
jgi:hypothetical protein